MVGWYVVNNLLKQSFLDRYQFRYILLYPSVSVLQDTTQSQTIPFNNTLVNIKPDRTLSLSQYSLVSYKIQLNPSC